MPRAAGIEERGERSSKIRRQNPSAARVSCRILHSRHVVSQRLYRGPPRITYARADIYPATFIMYGHVRRDMWQRAAESGGRGAVVPDSVVVRSVPATPEGTRKPRDFSHHPLSHRYRRASTSCDHRSNINDIFFTSSIRTNKNSAFSGLLRYWCRYWDIKNHLTVKWK